VALSTIKPNQAKPIVDVVTCFQMHYKDDLPLFFFRNKNVYEHVLMELYSQCPKVLFMMADSAVSLTDIKTSQTFMTQVIYCIIYSKSKG
jgi:hypothetical protein